MHRMSGEIAALTIGTRLQHDGETYEVTALDGLTVTLRSAFGRKLQVGVAAVLRHPTTRLLTPGPPAQEGVGAILSGLTEGEAAQLRDRVAHTREVLTGYRSGDPATAAPGEPRAGYNPSEPL